MWEVVAGPKGGEVFRHHSSTRSLSIAKRSIPSSFACLPLPFAHPTARLTQTPHTPSQAEAPFATAGLFDQQQPWLAGTFTGGEGRGV